MNKSILKILHTEWTKDPLNIAKTISYFQLAVDIGIIPEPSSSIDETEKYWVINDFRGAGSRPVVSNHKDYVGYSYTSAKKTSTMFLTSEEDRKKETLSNIRQMLVDYATWLDDFENGQKRLENKKKVLKAIYEDDLASITETWIPGYGASEHHSYNSILARLPNFPEEDYKEALEALVKDKIIWRENTCDGQLIWIKCTL